MIFKCKIGIHSWKGCKCTECGKTRNEQHEWSNDCEKCSICAITRINEHDWSKDCNKCGKCGKKKEESHVWIIDHCEKCGKNIWESDDPKIRLSSINNINDESILFKLAKDDKNSDVNIAAIRKINNQSLLAEYLIKTGKSYTSIQIEILKKIINQKLLMDIVRFSKNHFIQSDAVKKIEDQAFLKEIVLNDGYHEYIQSDAVEKIEDQAFLKEIVLNDGYHEDVHRSAINKITDQVFLYDIAKNEKYDYDIRRWCIHNINDQNMLKEIVLESKAKGIDETSRLRKIAVDQINNEIIFKEIVKISKDDELSEIVLKNISDQVFLYEFAVNKQNSVKNRIVASERITDQNLLQGFILNSSSKDLEFGLISAMDKINNQSLFISIIREQTLTFSDYVISSAIKKIEDQEILKDIFTNSNLNIQLKGDTIRKINDQKFLVEIVKGNYEESLRIIAINKVLNPQLILDCTKNDKSSFMLNSVASRIYDLNGKENKYRREKEIIKSRLFEDKQIHIYPTYINTGPATERFLDEIGLSTSNQIWMINNLNVTCFRNGEEIFEADNEEKWIKYCQNKKPAFCHYSFNYKNESVYGKIYNLYAIADHRGISPLGWRIPKRKDLFILEEFVKHPDYSVESVIMEEYSLKIVGCSYENGVFSGTNQQSKFWCFDTYDALGAYEMVKFSTTFSSSVRFIGKESNSGFSLLCIKE